MKQGTGSGSWPGEIPWIAFLSLGFCDEGVATGTDLEHGSACRAALNLHAFGLIQGAAVLGDGFWSRGWQDHRSSCVGGDGRDEGKRLALFDPGGSDLAADALVPRFGMGEAAAGVGLDEDLLVRRTVALDAADILDHPLIRGAEGIVGERVHTRVLEALFGGPAVPPLPDAGGSVLDREAPGGKGVVEEETIGHVMTADLGEDQHQVLGADETRREMVVALHDILEDS